MCMSQGDEPFEVEIEPSVDNDNCTTTGNKSAMQKRSNIADFLLSSAVWANSMPYDICVCVNHGGTAEVLQPSLYM